MHVFNSQHPAYTKDIWQGIVDNVGRIKKNFDGELDGFSRSMIKRQLYHMTFLEQTPDNPYETVSYNDSERMDDYNGYAKAFTDFYNSGLAESGALSFDDWLKLPNWLADWLVDEWAVLVRRKDETLSGNLENELKKIERQSQKKDDPFNNVY